ncbi:putative RNA 2'-phosphotransferase [Faunimonas pinastri]|uniref:Putative RNA 2'-phosphotransferase n=1 Tax=Faunimonas pinastri TaxID=1855383 RepID=A0A1H9P7X7_9HYPH|nr:putative RNA 2'-phosphotransferase [Faunimonas pinastri]
MSKEISKFLSYILRHAPKTIGLHLDVNGWADVSELLTKAERAGKTIDLETLRTVVSESDKRRSTISDEGSRIRAEKGHSVAVDLGLAASEPPTLL